MAITRTIWQWSFWSLLRKVLGLKEAEVWFEELNYGWPVPEEFQDFWKDFTGRAIEAAEQIASAGELEVVECTQSPKGFYTLVVYSSEQEKFWLVNIFPAHLTSWKGPGFRMSSITHISFKYVEAPLVREVLNPSSRLRIKSVRHPTP